MSDVPRALLVALGPEGAGLPVATRYALTVIWTYLEAADAQRARVHGLRARVRVAQTTIARITGEDPRSVRRHIGRLEEVGAAVRSSGELDLATAPEHLRGPSGPRIVESGGQTSPVEEDRATLGPSSPPDPPVLRHRTVESSQPDRRDPLSPSFAPSEAPIASSSYRDRPVKAFRPVAPEVDAPRGIGAREIITELAQEAHPPGAVRMRVSVAFVTDLERLLAGDDETPGEDALEVLRVSRAYLRILHERVPVARRRGAPPAPEDPKWWGPSMYQPRRWTVIVGIVGAVESAKAKAEAAARAPVRRDPALARLEAMEREAAEGRRVSAADMDAELRALRGERDSAADLAEVRARLTGHESSNRG